MSDNSFSSIEGQTREDLEMFFTESVHGTDDRNLVSQADRYTEPYIKIGQLHIEKSNGLTYICSGALVGSSHFLTAGHCVGDIAGGVVDPSDITVTMSRFDGEQPFGVANVTQFSYWTAYTDDNNGAYDIALLQLDRSMGDHLGWFSVQYNTGADHYDGEIGTVAGYPGDLSSGSRMYEASGPIDGSATQFDYGGTLDTAGGQSGAPLWYDDGGIDRLIGVHVRGGSIDNEATRITSQFFNWIVDKKNEWAAPTDRPDLIDWDVALDSNTASMSKTQASPGENISISMTLRNVGTAASGAFDVAFYASENTTISSADYLLGTVSVNSIDAFNNHSVTLDGILPSGMAVGDYHVGWVIDSNNTVNEFLETNNTGIIDNQLLGVTSGNTDDNYEANNSIGQAYNLTGRSGQALSTIAGLGNTQDSDPDYFRVDLAAPGQIDIDLLFSHAGGDIDLQLLDSTGSSIASSGSVSDNENIDQYINAAGTYYIYVNPYSVSTSNTYDLVYNFTPDVVNTPPVVAIADQTVSLDEPQWTWLSDVMNVTDADGDTITSYEIYDNEGGNNWYADGGIVDASTGYVTNNLSGIWFTRDGSASQQTLWVRANDGTEWGAWDPFTLTTEEDNLPPVVAIADQSINVSDYPWVSLSSVLSVTDANNDSITSYEVYDSQGGNNWYADGGIVDASTGYVTNDLSGIWFTRDGYASRQTLWVRANDGTEWGAWDPFELVTTTQPNRAPVVMVEDQTINLNQYAWRRLDSVLSVSDADGDAIVQYEVWDSQGDDNWYVNGAIVDASAGYLTNDLSNVWFTRDDQASTQTLWVRANDGESWGTWDSFDLITA